MLSENFLPHGPILIIVFLLKNGHLRGGSILIWSSSDDMIDPKMTEHFNSYEDKTILGQIS